jgi:hypothetical protein
MPLIDRPRFIALLNALGSVKDEDALAAAREIDRRIKEAGVTWDKLLRPAAGDDAEAHDQDADVRDAYADDGGEFAAADQAAGDLALINELLASDGISESTRSDLKDLAEDIANKRLRAADSRYVRSLHKRLIG